MSDPKYNTARIVYELANCRGMTVKELAEVVDLETKVIRQRLFGLKRQRMVYPSNGGEGRRATVWHINRRNNNETK